MKTFIQIVLFFLIIVLSRVEGNAQTVKMKIVPDESSLNQPYNQTIILNDSVVVMNNRVFDCDFKIGTYVSSEGMLYTKREYLMPESKKIIWYEINHKDQPFDYILIADRYYSIANKSYGVKEYELYDKFVSKN
jgi:hypothetical protein